MRHSRARGRCFFRRPLPESRGARTPPRRTLRKVPLPTSVIPAPAGDFRFAKPLVCRSCGRGRKCYPLRGNGIAARTQPDMAQPFNAANRARRRITIRRCTNPAPNRP
ncbi:hypothetical protein [Kingella potus]|uniref:hypothetical protein n=1 Tax=Kingella potus TaxID=265175 RepID=UPI001FD60974|nr:hypothetical protein [Kingella potus]UOP00500.1 hypothetical protein LVJ84_11715 [Kingella potus]